MGLVIIQSHQHGAVFYTKITNLKFTTTSASLGAEVKQV